VASTRPSRPAVRPIPSLVVLAVIGLVLAGLVLARADTSITSLVDRSASASAADWSEQHAAPERHVPVSHVLATRPQPTRTVTFSQLRLLLGLLVVLGTATLWSTAAGPRERQRAALADGIALLPHRRGPPAV
jgi:hypothetical protein